MYKGENTMSEHSIKKGTMAKDTVVYMIAKGIEGVIGVLTVSAFSHLFMPTQMGQYSTINVAVTTVAMVGIQWLIQSVLRYINKYDLENEQEKFYTTTFLAWLKVNLAFILIGSLIIILMQTVFSNFYLTEKFIENYPPHILYLGIIMFITYNTAQLLISMLAATRHAKTNLFLSVFSVTGKLLFIFLFVQFYGRRIEWIFISYSIFDAITSLVGIMKLKVYKYINIKNNSDEILKNFKIYGIPLVGNLIATSILNKSDIYVITVYIGEAAAGIYQTNYTIVASAFTMLSAAVMRGSYPTILRTWSEDKKELTEKLISEAVRFFLLIAVPAVIGITVLSESVATVLFDIEYIEGHNVMGWVALGMMFLGLTEYSIKPWELNANTKEIFRRSLLGGIVNIIINIIFIPIFGYKTAAISTFIGFFIYFCLSKLGTMKYMKWNLKLVSYIRIITSAITMGVVIFIIRSIISLNIITLSIMVISGIVVYGFMLYISGEIKGEVNFILTKFKNK